jgi:gas vesicle protein
MATKSLVSGHELNRLLDRVLTESKALQSDEFQRLLDENQRASLQRILFFARQLREHLATVSDFEVSLQALDTLRNQMQSVQNELQQFQSNRNPGHVANAAANLEGALQTFGWAFYKRPAKGSKAYGESIQSIENAARGSIAEIAKIRDEVNSSLADLRAKISSQGESLGNLQQASQDLASQNTAALQGFENRYKEYETRASGEFAQKLQSLEGNFDSFQEERVKQADGLIKSLESSERNAREIVQIVGNIGLTGNYQNRAISERTQANYLRWGAITFFLIGAGILAWSVIGSFRGIVEPLELVARALAALTISAPAVYLAKESARHRSNSDRAKQTELELASLAPFLESLPDDKRQEVIGSLSSAYFGTKVEEHQVSHPVELTAEQMLKLLVQMLDGKVRA